MRWTGAAVLVLVLAAGLPGCSSLAAQEGDPEGAEGHTQGQDNDPAEGEGLPNNFELTSATPRPGEFLILEAHLGDSVREVPDRGEIEVGEFVVFVTSLDPRGDEYVYLLEGTGGSPRMIHPRLGHVHLSREVGGKRRVRPRPASDVFTGEEEEPEGWQVPGGGWAQYRLVATPSPRDEAGAGSIGSWDQFLDPPPFVEGETAQPGRLVDSLIVRWK